MASSFISKVYLAGRRAARSFVASRPRLDQALGKRLVQVDLLLQRFGLVPRIVPADGSVECHGLTFHYRREDAELARQLFTNKDYETGTRVAIIEALSPGSTFVDLGAHIGYFTMLAARRVTSSGRVFAFEPMPGTRATLERNLAANHLEAAVTVAPFATSDRVEVLRFTPGATSEAAGVATAEDRDTLEVDATSLDAYFATRGWPHIDVVKMDVEGQELKTLAGMREVIARNPEIKVIFEYNLDQMRRNAIDRDALFITLGELGFRRYGVLFRDRTDLRLPEQIDELERLARRANVNVIAERG